MTFFSITEGRDPIVIIKFNLRKDSIDSFIDKQIKRGFARIDNKDYILKIQKELNSVGNNWVVLKKNEISKGQLLDLLVNIEDGSSILQIVHF